MTCVCVCIHQTHLTSLLYNGGFLGLGLEECVFAELLTVLESIKVYQNMFCTQSSITNYQITAYTRMCEDLPGTTLPRAHHSLVPGRDQLETRQHWGCLKEEHTVVYMCVTK